MMRDLRIGYSGCSDTVRLLLSLASEQYPMIFFCLLGISLDPKDANVL